ncbi:MAG: hypothetical protein JSV65_03300 [Armatimonadota bacterium]|nr:MAG: hypothetical protein JSV65_03300 [Armatimonadota bacterium]
MRRIAVVTIGVVVLYAARVCAHGNPVQEEASTAMSTGTSVDWAVRVIPLPQEMTITGGLATTAVRIHVVPPAESPPPVVTALEIIRSFALGGEDSPCRIRLALSSDGDARLPDGLAARFSALPNSDQAYAILSRETDGGAEIVLAANAPLGLLYAARTLQRLISPPSEVAPDTPLALPLGEIVDWPDIAERGQWGGNAASDFAWMAQRKLNVVELHAGAGCDENGQPTIHFDRAKITEGEGLGVKVVPILSHLEQLTRGGLKGWEDCYGTPSEERAKRSDFYPVLCMSKPRTWDLIAQWLKGIAAVPGVRDIMVWLSEEATPCFCEECAGKDPYALEVAAIVAGFRQAQEQVNPDARLRILTTQGSYSVNDKILEAAPRDVGVSYYDGGRTYDSSHHPMIYPLLEEFARSGRWLGVYPQVTNAWRTVFPWTGPQFVHARMDEFATKGLSNVICYAVPSNRFHEFNVTAAAEWSWNHNGRSPREFARAYACAVGVANIEAFADWADKIGPVGWDIAGSRLFLNLIYNPALAVGRDVPLDHRFESGPEVLSEEQIQRDLAQAREALAIARRLDLPDAVDETEITIASVKLLRSLYRLSHLPADAQAVSSDEIRAAADALDTLDQCAAVTSSRLRRWGERVCARSGGSMPDRLLDTLHVAPRAAAVTRGIIGAQLGIAAPPFAFGYWELGQWSAEDFADGPQQTLTFDATPYITQPGEYVVCFDFIDSAYGTDVKSVVVVAVEGDTRRRVLPGRDPTGRVSMWERWLDVSVPVPEVLPGCRYVVEIAAVGLPADAPLDRRTCAGKVGVRRNPPEDGLYELFFTD